MSLRYTKAKVTKDALIPMLDMEFNGDTMEIDLVIIMIDTITE